jgi:hypothetical protein
MLVFMLKKNVIVQVFIHVLKRHFSRKKRMLFLNGESFAYLPNVKFMQIDWFKEKKVLSYDEETVHRRGVVLIMRRVKIFRSRLIALKSFIFHVIF